MAGPNCTPQGTLDTLMSTHFPGSTQQLQAYVPETRGRAFDPEQVATFITNEKVSWNIQSFKPNTAAGPDGIKPRVLKNLGPKLLTRLTNLFKASYLLEFVPSAFRTSSYFYP